MGEIERLRHFNLKSPSQSERPGKHHQCQIGAKWRIANCSFLSCTSIGTQAAPPVFLLNTEDRKAA